MYKIALSAGHGLNTSGKRCMKKLDPKETREWFLNNRIADKVEKKLEAYEGYSLLRVDDTTGKKDIPLSTRTKKANEWGADDYYSTHHNAGIKGGKGGGIVVFTYTQVDTSTKELQKDLYEALIKHTGLKGDRSEPLAKADFHECRETKMSAVLMELGFMDSKTDVPIILSEEYAEQCADAIVEVMVKRGKLTKKQPPKTTKDKVYRVQIFAGSKKGAESAKKKAKAAGFDAIIV